MNAIPKPKEIFELLEFNAVKTRYKLPVVYCFLNKNTNKFYIGSAKNLYKRFSHHLDSFVKNKKSGCKLLVSSVRKHGCGAFAFGILEFLSPLSDRASILAAEQRYLDDFQPWKREIGYNLHPFADSPTGVKHSPELCAQNRAINIKILSNASLKVEDIPEIFKLSAQGKTRAEIAKIYNVAPVTISIVLTRRCWWHVHVDEELIKAASKRIPHWTDEAKAWEIGEYLSRFSELQESYTALAIKLNACRKAIANINTGAAFPQVKEKFAPNKPYITGFYSQKGKPQNHPKRKKSTV